MMRGAHLITCCATASSIAAYRSSAHGCSFPCTSSVRKAAFMMYSGRIRNEHHAQKRRDISSNRIRVRPFGSKSMNFQQQFLKKSVKSGNNDDEIDCKYPEKAEDDETEEADSYNYQPADDAIIARSMEWIERVVIGYNLCPFAERPLKENKLKVEVVRGSDPEDVASTVVYELVARSDESQPGTTVVVAPEYFPDDFAQYMSLVQYIEDDVMEEHELDGLVQIAPFHPSFEFAGSGAEGIDNFTNRSPYPMFHILREDEVEKAVEKLGGDASKVWSRNVRLLESMKERWGREGAERAMRGEAMNGMDTLLKKTKLPYHSDEDNGKTSQ